MSITVIIPNYNGQELLKKNLPKVISAVGDAEIIIVDDASTDGSLEILDSFKKKIIVIKNEKNLGFSATINRGVKAAKGDIVVLLNTDVIPEERFLAPLLFHFKEEKVFAVGCMDKSIEDGRVILRGRGIGKWQKGFLVHARGEVDRTNTLWVNGGSGAFRKSTWDKLGGFDALYSPFYWEDIDLSYRAQKAGYQIVFEPKSIVTHEHEKGAIKGAYSKFKINTIAYRNQFIFTWKNITDLSMQFNHIFWLPYHILLALVRMDVTFFGGLIQAIFILPKIIFSSFKSQKLFIETDEQVLDIFKNEK